MSKNAPITGPSRTKLVSRKDTRERLGISDTTLHRRLKENDFPTPIRIGWKMFFDETEVEAFINKCRAGAA